MMGKIITKPESKKRIFIDWSTRLFAFLDKIFGNFKQTILVEKKKEMININSSFVFTYEK